MVFSVVSFGLLLFSHMGPARMLLIGGVAGAFFLRGKAEETKTEEPKP